MTGSARHRVSIWAGIECSYNRVGDRYADQLQLAGLYERPEEIDRLTGLGVSAVRVPVLWERHCALGDAAWAWTDDVLGRLRRNGITPILGLMHHGSGPPGVPLHSSELPERLAGFARDVASAYPWARYFTPINEPLTTARFATLYGIWYPHERSAAAFAAAMLSQTRAISAAMDAIREITPSACLVQTEDMGRVYATGELAYQAEFENTRRWLTFDLLCGQVVGSHPMAAYFRWAGVSDRELEAVAEHACVPDIVGVNHYLTSERFLDHRIDRYPPSTHGGNHRHRYADVEAVRVLANGIAGPYAVLRETWERYGLPMAVTEAHLACTREQQLLWLHEVWSAAVRLAGEGGDVRAVTAWSAFGAHDWASLLTRTERRYESGLFDLRAPTPRRTALAQMVRSLAAHGTYDHPALHASAWWRSRRRLAYPSVAIRPLGAQSSVLDFETFRLAARSKNAPPVLIVGAGGTLGRAFKRACDARGLACVAVDRRSLDITNQSAIADTIETTRPWCVVNCAGFVRVDDAERERRACHAGNVLGAARLAEACAAYGIKLVTFSSDLVFDGDRHRPYVESDAPRPLAEYGRSKAAAEVMVLDVAPTALVVRTAAFFGDEDEANFVTQALRSLAQGTAFAAAHDVVVSPTYVPDLVDAALDLAIDDERGLWHLVNEGAVTWEELARDAARVAGVSEQTLKGVPLDELGLVARRPRYSALASERATVMPPLSDALARYALARPWERVLGVADDGADGALGPGQRPARITSNDTRSRPRAGGAAAARGES
jgi:dTDP-4-dehydrorhamnose reductase